MKKNAKLIACLLMLLSLISCGSSDLTKKQEDKLNTSNLYDPSSVTLIEGEDYRFKEGMLSGRGQKFYSQSAFSRAVRVGNDRNNR